MTAEELFPLLAPNLLRIRGDLATLRVVNSNREVLNHLMGFVASHRDLGVTSGELCYLYDDEMPDGLFEMLKAYAELKPATKE